MIADWEIGSVTVDGHIIFAKSEEMDMIYVQADDVSSNLYNLIQVPKDEVLTSDTSLDIDLSRAFSMASTIGSLALHGYSEANQVVGKRCLISSCKQFDFVSIEQLDGTQGAWFCWVQYTEVEWTDDDSVWFKVDKNGNKLVLQGVTD